MSDTLALAKRFFAAVQDGDIETARELYHPDVEVWHNFDMKAQTRDENLRVLAWMARKMPDRRYEEVRVIETPDGWAQQHVVRGTAPNGERCEIPAAIFITVKDGLITRLEEYLDPAQAAALSR